MSAWEFCGRILNFFFCFNESSKTKTESGRSWSCALQRWQAGKGPLMEVQVELLLWSSDFGDGTAEQELSYSQRMQPVAEEGWDGEELHRP